MKNKIFLLLFILLLVFVSGCQKDPDKTKYSDYEYSYDVTTSNISAFYDLEKTFKEITNGYQIDIVLKPKLDLLAKDLEIKYEYVIEYFHYGDNVYKTSSHDFTVFSSNETDVFYSIKKNNELSKSNFDLYSIKAVAAKGKIYTNQEVDTINTKEKLNKDDYDKLVLDMNEFDKKIYSNYLAVETNIVNKNIKGTKVTTTNDSSEVKMRLSPFYMETTTANSKTVLIEENNSIYSYEISKSKRNGLFWVDKSLLGESLNKEDYYDYEEILSGNDIDAEELDYSLITINIIDNRYILSGNLKEFITEEEFNDLQDIYTSLGYSSSVLRKATYILTIVLNQDN